VEVIKYIGKMIPIEIIHNLGFSIATIAPPSFPVMTDEFRSYGILDRKDSQFQRFVINHKENCVNGNIHTNGIEGFWSIFKRGFYGLTTKCP